MQLISTASSTAPITGAFTYGGADLLEFLNEAVAAIVL